MNKYLLFFVLPLITFGLMGCDDDDDVKPMYLPYLDGVWEVVDQGNQDVFERECFLEMSTTPHEAYGAPAGSITTFYLTVGGAQVHDKVYGWSIRMMDNHQPLLDVVLQGELDGDHPWEGNYYYKITRLTADEMWWQVNTNGDNGVIKFRRRNDLRSRG